uniref:hypothetical protein n=1 Tax=Spiroplasma kunkelii TaxID=47834 RepID=UPI000A72DF80|nr:hypothetical protein [Spiroplasma kunkelii]
MSNFVNKNQNVENYFISKEFIPFTTDKASFINLPNHNRHIGFWLSNKFIYSSEKHSELKIIIVIETRFLVLFLIYFCLFLM